MTSSLRHALISIAIVVLAFLAHSSLLQAGLLGDDLALLRESTTRATHGASAAWSMGGGVRPVPTMILRASGAAPDPSAPGSDAPSSDSSSSSAQSASTSNALVESPAVRVEHAHATVVRVVALVVLLLGAMTAGFALRRALTPWVGGDTARAAAFAGALFVAVHPLAGAALARPRGLGDLCVWFFGALAAFLFLRGRQMREKGWIVAAGLAAILAGFSGTSAWILPFVLAALELGSARRPRPVAERLRTAVTTLVLFSACVFVESATATALHARSMFASGMPDFRAWSSPLDALAASVEKLGLLFFPITGGTLSRNWPSYLVCIAIVLIALWPVLRSARVAPRLWGGLALTWIVLMFLALISLASIRIAPDDGSRADVLFVAAAFAATGLAVATTSLLGTRRIVLPAWIAIGFSWLSMRSAVDYATATQVMDRLRGHVHAAQADVGGAGRVLVVDPPEDVLGLDLGWERAFSTQAGGESSAPLQITADAIPFLTRTRMFAEWRAHKLVLLSLANLRNGETVLPGSTLVLAPTLGSKQPPWRGESRSPIFDLDPALVRFAEVRALPGTSSAEAPRMAWRASEPAGEWVVATGVWIEDETGLVALFDPWRHRAWWTASTIRRVRAEEPLVNVASFELLADRNLEVDGREPRSDRTDWIFELRDDRLARPVRGTATFVLEILAVENGGRIAYARFACEESVASGVRTLRSPGAEGFVAACALRGAHEFEWSLERRVGETAIARASGNTARNDDRRER